MGYRGAVSDWVLYKSVFGKNFILWMDYSSTVSDWVPARVWVLILDVGVKRIA